MAGERSERRRARGAAGLAARVWLLAPALAIAGAALTLAIALVPHLGFAFHAPRLHAAIETASALVSVLAAYLLVGRFELSGRLSDLALLMAATTLAVTNLAFSTVPAITGDTDASFAVWSASAGRAVAALAFAGAALLPEIRLARPRRAGALALGGTAGVVLAIGLIAALVPGTPATRFGPNPALSDAPHVTAPTGYLALQALTLCLFAAAAVGFSRRARRAGDELMGWFAAGTALATVSRLDVLLFPSVAPGWVQVGDVLRLGFYLLILVGALREIRAYQRRVSLAAVLDERRRLARDLHDGLAQELTFISMETRRLSRSGAGSGAERLREAAERALDESRAAISALSRRSDEPLASAVAQVAESLTARAGARLRLDLDRSVDLNGEARESLLRIVREAVSNGVRHGAASEVSIELRHDDGLRLIVSDNGAGFEAERPDGRADSFGLTSMRERALALGGRLEVHSRHGEGTSVEVVLP